MNDTTKPKPDKPDKPVPVRIPPEMVKRIDALRGYLPREPFVRDLLDKALKTLEAERGR
jgi:hypothetical protein